MKTNALIISLLAIFGLALTSSAREKSGVTEGILVSKDKKSITVLPDGAKETINFTPKMRGGEPDKKALEAIHESIHTNRVRVQWEFDERYRVVSIQVLKPKSKRGTVRGTVVNKGKNHVDVKPAGGGPVERYIPHWRGNGLDKDVLRQIAPIEVGQKVSVRWEYDERKRVLSIR